MRRNRSNRLKTGPDWEQGTFYLFLERKMSHKQLKHKTLPRLG